MPHFVFYILAALALIAIVFLIFRKPPSSGGGTGSGSIGGSNRPNRY